MKSVLIALFTLGLVSASTSTAWATGGAQTVKEEPSMDHDLGQGWRLFVHGAPPKLCAMMRIESPWGLTLAKYHTNKPYVLQITNMSWLIPGPVPIKFEFQFGDEPGWDQMGMSVNTKTVQTPVGQEFIYRWKAHRTLKVKINGSEINFDLLGTANGTKILEQCATALPSLSESCGKDCS